MDTGTLPICSSGTSAQLSLSISASSDSAQATAGSSASLTPHLNMPGILIPESNIPLAVSIDEACVLNQEISLASSTLMQPKPVVPNVAVSTPKVTTTVEAHTSRYQPSPDLSSSMERRSKRSIKRKRFDDEVVESSLPKQERPTRDRKGDLQFIIIIQ